MTDQAKPVQLDQLRASLKILDAQRAVLGDAIDPALQVVRQQIAALEAELAAAAPAAAPAEERRIVTILFSDIVGSTSLAENMDAEDWHSLIGAVHAMGSRVIQKHTGFILQYLGDGLLAIFGAPDPSERDAEEAVRAALDLQAGLAELHTHPPLQMRVGLHTGLVILGSIGSEVKHEYTAIGDAMNLAARLQSAAPPDGIIISYDTYRYVRGVFDLTPQPLLSVKGKSDPIQTYLVQCARPRPFRTVTRGVAGIETATIGREAELKQLRAVFQRAQIDRKVVWAQILGEPGIGKSRLMSDARDALDLLPDHFRWLRARAFQGDEKQAFSLVRRLWFDRFQIAEDAPLPEAEARWLSEFTALSGADQTEAAQALGLLVGLPFRDSLHVGALRHDPAQVKGRATVISRELFAALRADLPIVILLEDLHWADPSSWDYLTQLLLTADDTPPPHGLLVIATARPEWQPPAALLKHPDYLPLNLTALSAPACHELAATLLRRIAGVPAEVIQLIVDRSEGVPYYVEEIINWFLDRGIIDRSSEPWRFDLARLHEAPLPNTLQQLLSTRLSLLADDERLSLQHGAIFGRHFWGGGLEALGTPDYARTLQQLQLRGFIEAQPESALAGEREWSFQHNLLREATYESILKRDRRSLHKAAAAWLEQQAQQAGRLDEFVGILGEHAERANDAEAATDWYLRAGERAMAQGATQEAHRFFERVLDLVPPADRERRWRALLGRGDALDVLGEQEARQADLATLLDLAQQLDDARRAEAHYRQGNYWHNQGNYHAALLSYDTAIALAQRADHVNLEARVKALKAIGQQRLGDEQAAVTAESALSLIPRVDEATAVRTVSNVAVYYLECGDLAKATQLQLEQVAIGQRRGDRASGANALANLGYAYTLLGLYDLAHEAQERALYMHQTIAASRNVAYALLNLGLVHWRLGDNFAAHTTIKQAQTTLAELGDAFGHAAARSYLALVFEQAGDVISAQDCFAQARAAFAKLKVSAYEHDALAGLARGALSAQDRDRVRSYVTELWTYLGTHSAQGMEFPLRAYLTCVECFTALADTDCAHQAIEAGYWELIARAEKISQMEWGRSFLFNVPEHRALIELREQIAA